MKEWLKKYSIQLSLVSTIAGSVIAIMPYFDAYLSQSASGIIMAVLGILTIVGRVIPQTKTE